MHTEHPSAGKWTFYILLGDTEIENNGVVLPTFHSMEGWDTKEGALIALAHKVTEFVTGIEDNSKEAKKMMVIMGINSDEVH